MTPAESAGVGAVVLALVKVLEMIVGKFIGKRSTDMPSLVRIAESQAQLGQALKDVAESQRMTTEMLTKIAGRGKVRSPSGMYPITPQRIEDE